MYIRDPSDLITIKNDLLINSINTTFRSVYKSTCINELLYVRYGTDYYLPRHYYFYTRSKCGCKKHNLST